MSGGLRLRATPGFDPPFSRANEASALRCDGASLLAIVEYDARDTVVLSLLVAPRPPWADVAEIPKRFVGLFNRPDSPAENR
jgi:hypothetical protein